jgi:hypothetical protein
MGSGRAAALTLTATLLATACGSSTPTSSTPADAAAMDARCKNMMGQRPAATVDGTDTWGTRHALAVEDARATQWFVDQSPPPIPSLAPLVADMRTARAAAGARLGAIQARDEDAFEKADDDFFGDWARFTLTADRAGLPNCANSWVQPGSWVQTLGPDAMGYGVARALMYAQWWCGNLAGHLPATDRSFVVDDIANALREAAQQPSADFPIQFDTQDVTYGDVAQMIEQALQSCPDLPAGDPDGAALKKLDATPTS